MTRPSLTAANGGYAAFGVCALLIALYPVVTTDLYYQNMIILSLLLAIMGSSWNVISGFAGYVSIGQSAFLGIGAYTTALFAVRVFDNDVSPFWFVPVSAVVAGAFAAVVGAVLMRTRGHAFVILTIAFLFIMQIVTLNWSAVTNGNHGVTLPLPRWSRDYQYWPFYYSLLLVLLLTVALAWWIRRTKFGMGLIAIREDESKAASVGVNTPVYKVLGFVASAVFIGAAGGIYAYYLTFIDPRGMFDIVISVQIVLAVLLGGRGTVLGPVLGAFILEPLNEISNNEFAGGNERLIFFGGLLAVVVLVLPRGIIPSVSDIVARRRRRATGANVGARLETRIEVREWSAAQQRGLRTGRPLLEVEGIEKRFGGLQALGGCSLAVEEGTITGLIGPNGSGKTTLFNIVDGTMGADAGEVRFGGERIDGLARWSRAHRGLARTYQITRLFREMTVLENVVAPLRRFSWRQLAADAVSGAEATRAEELLDFVGMRRFRDQRATDLSYGQQKLVELAQVLMLDPKLILLDEPAGGINPTLIEQLAEMIRELNRNGTSFLIVEHNMPLVLSLCDPVHVLAQGSCICSGDPAAVQADPLVLDAYLGDDYLAEVS